jgi:hypothetical protein
MEKMAEIPFLVDFSPPTLLVALVFLAQVLVRSGTPGLDRFCSRRAITIRSIAKLKPAESRRRRNGWQRRPRVPILADLKMRQWTSDRPRGAIDDSET